MIMMDKIAGGSNYKISALKYLLRIFRCWQQAFKKNLQITYEIFNFVRTII